MTAISELKDVFIPFVLGTISLILFLSVGIFFWQRGFVNSPKNSKEDPPIRRDT
jgi:uncharacterized protein YneF (UPF0154 family)